MSSLSTRENLFDQVREFVENRDIKVEKTHFKGNPFNESLGLLYMTHFHKNSSTLLSGKRLNIVNVLKFSDYSVSWKCGSKKGKRGDISLPKKFYQRLLGRKTSDLERIDIGETKSTKDMLQLTYDRFLHSRFVICYVDIKKCEQFDKDDHANVLVFDRLNMTMERFEPHGAKMDFYDYKMFDLPFGKALKKHGIRYIEPREYIPEIGIQDIQEKEKKAYRKNGVNISVKGDPGGFCSVWCLFYIDLRLSFPNENVGILLQMINDIMRNKFPTFGSIESTLTSYIRGYSEYMFRAGRAIFKDRISIGL